MSKYITKLIPLFIFIFISCNSKSDEVVKKAKTFIGVPYVLGGESYKGIDCSGLTWHCFYKTGYNWKRLTAKQQSEHGTYISKSKLKKGDMIFFKQKKIIDHVGIVVSVDFFGDDLEFIHASQCSGHVAISNFSDYCGKGEFYWKDIAISGRRIY